jgi:hexosaminidase
MAWRGIEYGIRAAAEGHEVVMTPTSHCYFDYYQANPDFEPVAIGGFTTLKKVYSFDPTPPVLTEAEAKHILGGQGNVWTEYIPTPEHAEYMSTPRMTALAEVLWSPKEKTDWNDFRKRLESQFERFEARGVNYSKGSYAIDFVTDFDKDNKQFIVKFETEQLNHDIHFTMDGTDPAVESAIYTGPLIINSTTTIKAGIFEDGELKENFSEKTIVFHKGLGAGVKYKTEPNFRYPGQGKQNLVDGLKGTKSHNDGLWQGFQGDDLDVTIDLGEVKPISRVSASFYQRERSWIFLPQSFEVSYSEDGKNYSRIKSVDNPIHPKTEGAFIEEFGIDLPSAKARFIKVRASNLGICPEWHPGAGEKCWLFVDEVVVE